MLPRPRALSAVIPATIAVLLLAVAGAIFAGCSSSAADGSVMPDPTAQATAATAVAQGARATAPAPVSTAVAQAEATVMAVAGQVATDYCGRLCQVSFWLHASVADLDAEISKGATVNAKGGVGYVGSPLHYAVRYADSSVIAALLERGVDLEAKDSNGFTALHIIAQSTSHRDFHGHPSIHLHNDQESDVTALLLERGANANAQTDDGFTPLHYANDPVVAALLLNYGADVNRKSNYGVTPLHLAVGGDNYRGPESQNIMLAALLLESGANVNAVTQEWDGGYTPVMTAVAYGVERTHAESTRDVVDLLVEHGADLDAKMPDGRTAREYVQYFSSGLPTAAPTPTREPTPTLTPPP